MQYKTFSGLQLKANQPGAFLATIATLNVVDHDGDVTVPGAFKQGQEVVISAYQHGSWEGALPVGKGIIGANDSRAWVDGEFFLSTLAGKETYATVKALGRLVEWSYGFDPIGASYDPGELAQWPGARRILTKLDVFEASPVLKGAGIGTGTDSIKGNRLGRREPSLAEIAERLKRDMPRLEFEAISARIADMDRKDYGEVEPSAVHPELRRIARLTLEAACKALGISQWPRVRWFTELRSYEKDQADEIVSFRANPMLGQTKVYLGEIWCRADIDPASVSMVVAHECKHYSQGAHTPNECNDPATEKEALAFGFAFQDLMFGYTKGVDPNEPNAFSSYYVNGNYSISNRGGNS
jgi:hypothetical protein